MWIQRCCACGLWSVKSLRDFLSDDFSYLNSKSGHLRNDGARIREIWGAWRMLEIAALENGGGEEQESKTALTASLSHG